MSELCVKCAVFPARIDGRCDVCEKTRLMMVDEARAAYSDPEGKALLDLSKDWSVERACAEAWERAATTIDKPRRLLVCIVADPPNGFDDEGMTAYQSNVEGGPPMLARALRELADKIDRLVKDPNAERRVYQS